MESKRQRETRALQEARGTVPPEMSAAERRDMLLLEQRFSAHPGFKAVASRIAKKQGVSKQEANAILAQRSRQASPMAKRKNPRLKRVAQPKKKGGY